MGDTQTIAEGLTVRKKSGLFQLSGGNATPALASPRAARSPGEEGGAVGRELSLVAGLWGLCPSSQILRATSPERLFHSAVEVVAEREGDLLQAILAGPGRARLGQCGADTALHGRSEPTRLEGAVSPVGVSSLALISETG